MTKKRVDDLFFELFCEKNSDGTRRLRLHGRELFQRFGYRLGPQHMTALASFLGERPDVTSIDLSYNDIGDQGMKILTQKFFVHENQVVHLNLLHCDLHAEGVKWLSRGLFLYLKSLKLEGNKFGRDGARFVGAIVQLCDELEDLDIGETDQTLLTIESLLMVIEISGLKSLNISRVLPMTYHSQYNTAGLAEDIRSLLKLNSSLEVLRLEKCQFDGHDMEIIIGGLSFHPNLLMLDLAANQLGDHGLSFLCKYLKTRPKLLGLRLTANGITEKGAQELSLHLPYSRIRYLDLQNNRISKNGLKELLYSLKKSTPMRVFFIWGNEFSPKVLEQLDRLLRAGVLEQDSIDVKIYTVDGVKQAAYYPASQYANRAYSVYQYGFPPELKIVKNVVAKPTDPPRALIDFDYIDRYPPAKPQRQQTNDEEGDRAENDDDGVSEEQIRTTILAGSSCQLFI